MMNNEEIERKMNFIVEQQAHFASDIQQLQESQARTEQNVARTSENVAQTTGAVTQVVQTMGQMVDVVTHLANVTHAGFTAMHEGFAEVNAKINALVDAGIRTEENLARTDANLNKLTSDVDRYLRGKNET